MTNGEILAYFFEGYDNGRESQNQIIKDFGHISSRYCPNADFQERYPCGSVHDDPRKSNCENCWAKFLSLDDGLEVSIKMPNGGDSDDKL